ncbi:MAG: hypothetical protein AAFN77_20750 [Planctomycetota bacterium]
MKKRKPSDDVMQTVSEFLVDILLGRVSEHSSFELGCLENDDATLSDVASFAHDQLPILAIRCHIINEEARTDEETYSMYRVRTIL